MIRITLKLLPLLLLSTTPALAGMAEEYAAAEFFPGGWTLFGGEVFRSIDVIGFILIAFLLVLIAMGLDILYHLRLSKFIPETLLADVQEEMINGEYEKALELCEKSDSPIGQVFAAALAKTDYSFERMSEAMHNEVQIQGLVWRQWVGQFRVFAVAGFLLGFVGAAIEGMRLVTDMIGRPDFNLALASSYEVRSIVYNFLFALMMGALLSLLSLAVSGIASSRLEKILLESKRLGEELLDPFRPLPVLQEE